MNFSELDAQAKGLKFDGYPSNEEKFIWIVAQQGCHPKAAQRILGRIKANGYDLLTMTNELNFKWIIEQLALINVTATFIQPLKDWGNNYDDGDWPEELIPKKLINKYY